MASDRNTSLSVSRRQLLSGLSAATISSVSGCSGDLQKTALDSLSGSGVKVEVWAYMTKSGDLDILVAVPQKSIIERGSIDALKSIEEPTRKEISKAIEETEINGVGSIDETLNLSRWEVKSTDSQSIDWMEPEVSSDETALRESLQNSDFASETDGIVKQVQGDSNVGDSEGLSVGSAQSISHPYVTAGRVRIPEGKTTDGGLKYNIPRIEYSEEFRTFANGEITDTVFVRMPDGVIHRFDSGGNPFDFNGLGRYRADIEELDNSLDYVERSGAALPELSHWHSTALGLYQYLDFIRGIRFETLGELMIATHNRNSERAEEIASDLKSVAELGITSATYGFDKGLIIDLGAPIAALLLVGAGVVSAPVAGAFLVIAEVASTGVSIRELNAKAGQLLDGFDTMEFAENFASEEFIAGLAVDSEIENDSSRVFSNGDDVPSAHPPALLSLGKVSTFAATNIIPRILVADNPNNHLSAYEGQLEVMKKGMQPVIQSVNDHDDLLKVKPNLYSFATSLRTAMETEKSAISRQIE